jgi:NAD(P)-dependent dehydrogenase (short-subunit alcohol dehydrogenase family)
MPDQPLAVIAGAGPGLGLAIARRFARGGFRTALLARNPGALAAEVEGAQAFAADLADPAAVTAAMAAVAAAMGPARVLAWNAARWNATPAMAIAPAEFHRDPALGVTGALAAAQAAYPGMRAAGGGTVLLTGGGLALRPEFGAGVASLVAAKSALRGLAHALAAELAPEGIHVATVTVAGTIAPGTGFDPDRIAEAFWTLHIEPRKAWRTEQVFTGA